MSRASWDEYFIDIAYKVATRATCDRKHVGAVVVLDRMVLSTGYNGAVRGAAHCDQVGHLMEDGHCVRTTHAEANAIAMAAARGASLRGSTVYVTAFPCWGCVKLLKTSGVVRVVYNEAYRLSEEMLRRVQEIQGFSVEKLDRRVQNYLDCALPIKP